MLITQHPSPHLSAARWVNRPCDQCCSAGDMSLNSAEFKYWSTYQWFPLDKNVVHTAQNVYNFATQGTFGALRVGGRIMGWLMGWQVGSNSQFNGFVPHDDVAWERKGLHVDNVDVPSFCADVQPFTLEGQVAESYSVKRRRGPQVKRVVSKGAREEEEKGWMKYTDSWGTETSWKITGHRVIL